MSSSLYHALGQLLAGEQRSAFSLNLSADELARAEGEGLCAGDRIAVVDDAQDYFSCEVLSFEGGCLCVRFAQREASAEVEPSLLLSVGLVEDAKMLSIVRTGAELGVEAFLPVAFGRCGAKRQAGADGQSALGRWRDAARDASLHAGRQQAPRVHEPVDVEEACELLSGAAGVLVCWEEAPEAARLRDALRVLFPVGARDFAEAPLAVVVGPEGGLSEEEVEALLSCNPRSSLVSLGPSVLRVETAAVVAPALVLYSLGGLGGSAATGRGGEEGEELQEEARP